MNNSENIVYKDKNNILQVVFMQFVIFTNMKILIVAWETDTIVKGSLLSSKSGSGPDCKSDVECERGLGYDWMRTDTKGCNESQFSAFRCEYE